MANEYLAVIERYFVLLLGRGLMLSATDVALVEEWYQAQIPADLVCRGLASGANVFRDRNGADTPLPAALHRYQSFVEDAVQNAPFSVQPVAPVGSGLVSAENEVLTTGSPAESPLPPALPDAPCWIDTNDTDSRRQGTYVAALQAFREHQQSGDYEEATLAAQTTALSYFLSQLSSDERAQVEDSVEERVAPERGKLGRRGLQLRRRAILQNELQTRYGLVTERTHDA